MKTVILFLFAPLLFANQVETLQKSLKTTKKSVTKIEAVANAWIKGDKLVVRVGYNNELKKPLGLNIALVRGKKKYIVPVSLSDKERTLKVLGYGNIDLEMPLKEICYLAKGCKKKSYKAILYIFIDRVFWKDYRPVDPNPSPFEWATLKVKVTP